MSGERSVRVGIRVHQPSLDTGDLTRDGVCPAYRGADTHPSGCDRAYDFDWTFDYVSSQRSIYSAVCEPLVPLVFAGYSATVIAHGPSGSGKSHTLGISDGSLSAGIIPFCIQGIFASREKLSGRGEGVEVRVSCMEVYNGGCYDLIANKRKKLYIHKNRKGLTCVIGNTCLVVGDEIEAKTYLREALRLRVDSGQSSRSHVVFKFMVRSAKVNNVRLLGELCIVDMADSANFGEVQQTHSVQLQPNTGKYLTPPVVCDMLSSRFRGNGTVPSHKYLLFYSCRWWQ